jgi:hypothetical protein
MIKLIDETEYEIVKEWWIKRGFPIIPLEFLPSRRYIAYKDETPLFAGFLYVDNECKFAFLTLWIANPDVQHSERTEGFNELVEHVSTVTKELGVRQVHTIANNPSLLKRLDDAGYKAMDVDTVYLIKE